MDTEWKPDEDGKFVCLYNDACHCDIPTCGCCGWNPKVARRRLLEYIKAIGAKKNECDE